MIEFDYFKLIWLISGVITLVLGICLIVISVPKEPELRNYRISRFLLALAYISLSVKVFFVVFGQPIPDGMRTNLSAIMLLIPSVQALLFTFAIITLIDLGFVTSRRVWTHLVLIFSVASILTLLQFTLPEKTFISVAYLAMALYGIQIVIYVIIFLRQYNLYCHKLDNFFSGDEKRRTSWIRDTFFMATGVGIASGVTSIIGTKPSLIVFIFLYTVIYIYFAVRYINYVGQYYHIAPVVMVVPESEVGGEIKDISKTLEKWIEDKNFVYPDITLESLAYDMNTNRFYLSRHINSEYGQNFK